MDTTELPKALLATDNIHAFQFVAALRRLGLDRTRWPLIAGYDAMARFAIPDDERAWTPDLSIDRGNAQVASQAISLITARASSGCSTRANPPLAKHALTTSGSLAGPPA